MELMDWYDHNYGEIESYLDTIREDIKSLPSTQKSGKWITGGELNGKGIIPPTDTDYRLLGCRKREFWTDFLYCSVCYKDAYSDTDYGFQLFDFCPHCGARMEKIIL